MSSSRSVQAAQRRRVGQNEPPMQTQQTRYPQPSINSAQAFASQTQIGRSPVQQQQQQQQQAPKDAITKMTINQAITLITLRLGSVESKLIQIEYEGSQKSDYQHQQQHQQEAYADENMILIDKSAIDSITRRIETLEKLSSANNSVSTSSGPEVAILKQQLEAIKPIIIQTKNASTTVIKENKDLKIQVDNLRQELNATKELLQLLQNTTIDHSQKIMSLSMGIVLDDVDPDDSVGDGAFSEQTLFTNFNVLNDTIENENEQETDNENVEIYGATLKELIEKEINLDSNDL